MIRFLTTCLAALACAVAAAAPARPPGTEGFYVAPVGTLQGVTYAGAASAIVNVPVAPGTQVYRVFDPKGVEFRARGVNRPHYDSWGSDAGIPLSGANTERTNPYFSRTAAQNLADLKKITAAGIVAMPGNWGGTCKDDPKILQSIVDTWVAQAATWTTLNKTGIVNIANEWGPPNNPVWRDAYITAVKRMRAAGYTGLLAVDSGGCGQDAQDVVKYGAEVLAADPLKNIVFDVHVYGGYSFPATVAWQQDFTKGMAQLKATGLPIILGEFGPGRHIGPSPTLITPAQVIAKAEAYGWGWLAWAWDDNNLGSCRADDNWFAMTKQCGVYKTDDDLTMFGKQVVPILKAKSVKAKF